VSLQEIVLKTVVGAFQASGPAARSQAITVGCPKDFSLSWQNFVPLDEGVPLERGRQRGVPSKRRYCATNGSYSV